MPMKELMLWKPDALLLWKPDEGAVSVIVEIAELCNFNDCLYGICEDRAWYSHTARSSQMPVVRFLAGCLQFRRFVDVVVGQDALPGNTSRRPGVCTRHGTLLLECGA